MALPHFSSEVQPAGMGSAVPVLPRTHEVLLTPQPSAGEHQEGKLSWLPCVWVQQSLNILLCASVWCFVWWVTLQSCCLGSASQKVPVSSPKLLWRRWHSRDLVLNSSVGWNNVVSCRLIALLQPLPAIPLQLVLLLSKQSFYSSLPPELFFSFWL